MGLNKKRGTGVRGGLFSLSNLPVKHKINVHSVVMFCLGFGLLAGSPAHALTVLEKSLMASLSDSERVAMEIRIAEDKERFRDKQHLLFNKSYRGSISITQPDSQTDAVAQAAANLFVGSGPSCTHSTIQAAVTAAASGDTIWVMNETFAGNAALFNVIDKSLRIVGGRNTCENASNFSGYTTLDGSGMSGADTIIELVDNAGGMEVRLNNLIVTGGLNDPDRGGGIEITGKLSATLAERLDVLLSNVNIFSNTSDFGGGIHATDADLFITGESVVQANHADLRGGGVYCLNSSIYLTKDSVIGKAGDLPGNSAEDYGGGLYLDNCNLTLDATDGSTGAYITGNSSRWGGGLYEKNTSETTLRGDKAQINLNTSSFYGGGIYAELDSTVYSYNGSIKGNGSGIGGGGYFKGASLFMLRSADYPCHGKCNELSENYSVTGQGGGAAFSLSGGEVTLDGVWIEGNYATTFASAPMIARVWGTLNIRNSMIVDNKVPDGVTKVSDTMFVIGNATVTMEYNTFAGNESVSGNGNFLELTHASASMVVDSNIFWNNQNMYPVGGIGIASFTNLRNISDLGFGANINPSFLVPGSNYHISTTSGAVDYGTESLDLLHDIDGESRGLTERPDAGADEANARVGVAGEACGYSTIADAIAAATDGDTIYIGKGNYLENATIIDKSLTLVPGQTNCLAENMSALQSDVVVDGSFQFSSSGGVFEVSDGKTVSFKNMILQNAHANYGGIIYTGTGSSLTLDHVWLRGGIAQRYGGGIRAHGDLQLINGSDISGNQARNIGSATGNAQRGGGVAISSTGSLLLGDDSIIRGNTAAAEGGGVYGLGDVRINPDASVWSNSAANGAGIYLGSNTTNRVYGTVETNNATFDGGGLYVDGSSDVITTSGSFINNNSAGQDGGGVYIRASSSSVSFRGGISLYQNTADNNGGGLYVVAVSANTNVTVEAPSFSGNRSVAGGGIYYDSGSLGGTLHILYSILVNNVASGDGGGIYIGGTQALAELTLTEGSIVRNDASGHGGGLYVANGSNFVVTDSSIRLNSATDHGGGVYLENGAWLSSSNTEFATNSAFRGGGMYLDSSVTTSPRAVLENLSIVKDNTATYGAGAYLAGNIGKPAQLAMFDGSFTGNDASSLSGAIYASVAQVVVERSLFANNVAPRASISNNIDSTTTYKNTIFYANSGSELFQAGTDAIIGVLDSTFVAKTSTDAFDSTSNSAQVVVRNSILSGFNDSFSGLGILTSSCMLDSSGELGVNAAPLFVDAPNHDYHLQSDSPAINKCETGLNHDYDSNSRPVGSGPTPYDIGAFEYRTPVPSYELTVSVQGSGTVTSNPGGIDCGVDCQESYISGTEVALIASAETGFIFDSWSGACTGTGSCNVVMSAGKSVQASFVLAADLIFKDSFD